MTETSNLAIDEVSIGTPNRHEALRNESSVESQAELELIYKTLIDALPDAVLIHQDRKIAFVNPACLRLLAADSPSQLLGREVSSIVHPDFLPMVKERIRRNYAGQTNPPSEQVLIALDGTTVQIEAVATPLQWHGAPAIQVVARDITARKRAEDSVRNWIKRLELAQKAGLRIGLWEWNIDANTLVWSDETYRQFGYSRDTFEATSENFFARIDPKDCDRVQEAVQKCIDGSPEYSVQFRVARPDGTICWIDSRGVVVANGSRKMIGVAIDITHTKEAEQRLRESEGNYRLLLNSTAEGIYGVDKHGVCTFCNPAAARLFGYPDPKELIGKCVHLLHHHSLPDGTSHSSDKCKIYSSFRSGKRVHVDDEDFFRTDGSQFPVEYWSYPIHRDSEVVGSVVTFLDISDRRRAEEALRKSEEHYRLLFERNPQPMWVYHKSSLRFLAVNQAAVDHYGYSRSEFLSMTIADIHPSEDVPALVKSASSTLSTDKGGLWRHRTKNGRIIYVEITDCILDFEGYSAGLVLANDITEQKRVEHDLMESEVKYRELFENATFGIFRSAPGGELLDVNPAMVEMLGYSSKEEVVTRNLNTDIYLNSEDRAGILSRCDAKGRVESAEVQWKRKDGTIISVRLCGRAIRKADGDSHYEVIVEDITERRLLEEQFRQVQKMEAVGRLAGGIAHDFNNILGVITGYSELIQEEKHLSDKSKNRLKEINKAAMRAADLTRQLLAFSRKQVQELKVFELNLAVSDTDKMLRRLVGEDIQLTTKLSPGTGLIKADLTQIEQVIMNLAVNARDAMPSGGELIIETESVYLDKSYWQKHARALPGSYAMLAVSDTGEGMTADVKARIFEPFFTTKEQGRGTGLGLSTVYGIVKQSGGYIWVYSEPGCGTTFKIYFPHVGQGAAEVIERSPDNPPPGGSETVLLVEDESSLRELNEQLLVTAGYKVLTAQNGEEALRIATAHTEPIHLLFTDVVMPRMNGPDLARQLTALRPDIKVIYTSGYTDNLILQKPVLEPGVAFIQKPFSRDTLKRKLREILG